MIYESDLYLLVNLFFPDATNVTVLDPEHKIKLNYESGFHLVDDQAKIKKVAALESMVVVNLTDVPIDSYPFDTDAISGAISFRENPEVIQGMESKPFYYVINEEVETIRWVFNKELAKPFFLDYYDPEADYGNFFRWFTRLCGTLRQMNWVADEKFHVFFRERPFYKQISEATVNGFTLFTGRYLTTGKVVLQLLYEQNVVKYLKWPLTAEAEGFLKQESHVLTTLNKKDFQNLIVPYPESGTNNSLLLNNILKLRPKGIQRWSKYHFKAIGEYTREFLGERSLEDLLKKENLLDQLGQMKEVLRRDETPKGLSTMNTTRVYQQLVYHLNQMPLDTKIPVSLVHWDFTPENVQIEEGVLKILDWEQARFDHPVLIDVFEFLFYNVEDNFQPSLALFEKGWKELKQWEAFHLLQQEFQADLNIHFRLYLLLRIIPLLNHYLEWNFVPYWMNWHLYFWKEVLAKVNEEENWLKIEEPQST